jgi:hypothetical protein
MSPPQSPPPPPPPLEVSEILGQHETLQETFLSETIRVGPRYISIQGSQFDGRRPVYRMFHRAKTLH